MLDRRRWKAALGDCLIDYWSVRAVSGRAVSGRDFFGRLLLAEL